MTIYNRMPKGQVEHIFDRNYNLTNSFCEFIERTIDGNCPWDKAYDLGYRRSETSADTDCLEKQISDLSKSPIIIQGILEIKTTSYPQGQQPPSDRFKGGWHDLRKYSQSYVVSWNVTQKGRKALRDARECLRTGIIFSTETFAKDVPFTIKLIDDYLNESEISMIFIDKILALKYPGIAELKNRVMLDKLTRNKLVGDIWIRSE